MLKQEAYMNIKDLEYFQVVCQEKSITRAAKVLYLSPQGLSRILQNMESELNTTLLIRSKSGIKLTESGEVLLKYTAGITDSYHRMEQEIRNIENQRHGEVDLLSAYGILRLLTPECLTDFKEKYPDITFTYREFPDCQVERLFLKKEGNIAFSIAPFQGGLYDVTELESFPVKLLVNRKHPLSSRRSVTIDDLRGEKIFIENSEFKIYHLIYDKCIQAGFTPDIVFETSGFSLCHKLCAQNKGISVTVDFIFDDMKNPDTVMIPFSDGIYEWKACMLTRRGEYVSRETELFQKHVMRWMHAIASGKIRR